MTLPEWLAYAPALSSTAGALRALWRLACRRPPSRPPALDPPSCTCATWRVIRYEAPDGAVLTAWDLGPVPAAAGPSKEHRPW